MTVDVVFIVFDYYCLIQSRLYRFAQPLLCFVLVLVSVFHFWIYVVIWAEHRAEVRTA